MKSSIGAQIVALGGGVGTRFWPVSRRRRPKQLLALGGGHTLLSATFERARPLARPADWWMVVGEGHADVCRRAVPEVLPEHVLVEPVGRNTAPAVGLAALHIARRCPDGVMVVLPADQTVGQPAEFRKALARAVRAAEGGGIVTLGIEPEYAETGYGYIAVGAEKGDAHWAERFIEKPALPAAQQMVEQGGYVWNAGIFVMRATTYLAELKRQLPAMYEAFQAVRGTMGGTEYAETLRAVYLEMENISIDYGIMENAEEVLVVPVGCAWSDVGSWRALGALVPKDGSGNIQQGRAVSLRSRNCVVSASDGHVVALLGVNDLVVVHTPDATLVMPVDEAQNVREVVQQIKDKQWNEYL